MVKYVVYAGDIKARDGQIHWLSASRVAQLYRAPYDQCYFMDGRRQNYGKQRLAQHYLQHGAIILRPRMDGNYNLDNRIKEAGSRE